MPSQHKMRIIEELQKLELTPENSIVIGSGILNALNIRASQDIDVVVTSEKYDELAHSGDFIKKSSYNREILTHSIFEIGTTWGVLGKDMTFYDLSRQSIIISDVRYINVQFLLDVKQSWITGGTSRPKDHTDVILMEEYLLQ